MKKKYLLKPLFMTLLMATCFANTFAQAPPIINIPDPLFKAILLAQPFNTNHDGEIDEAEALLPTQLGLGNGAGHPGNVTDVTGLEKFTNLENFDCIYNQITSIPIRSLPNLKYLNFDGNRVTSFNCDGHQNIVQIYGGGNTMASFSCNGCPSLNDLFLGNNLLTTLHIENVPSLTQADIRQNKIASLFLLGAPNLLQLSLFDNKLTRANVYIHDVQNIKQLHISNNLLTGLDIFTYETPNLEFLGADNNLVTDIDVSFLNHLTRVDCNNNPQLTTLNIKNGVSELINFSGCPTLQYICADDAQVSAITTAIAANGYTNCFTTSYCSFFPGGSSYNTIQGTTRLTNNFFTGCSFADPAAPQLKYNVTGGGSTISTFANATGNYAIAVPDGSYNITPWVENPSYFYPLGSVNISFPSSPSPALQDFCLVANGAHDDLEIMMLPLTAARPGFTAEYKIIYKNVGTTVSPSATVTLNYDDISLAFASSSPAAPTISGSDLTWSTGTLQPFESGEITLKMNVHPYVSLGSILNFAADITPGSFSEETPVNNTFIMPQTVVGAYDPNDKTCIEGEKILASTVGNYVHYIIRFENTGTFAAQNIVVKDLIDLSKFDINSLVPLNGSHAFTTRILNNNQVDFIFENINLPFAAGSNDGYVAFKIKTLPTLVTGNFFENKVNIYFDYNPPIVTNTAHTDIVNVIPIKAGIVNNSGTTVINCSSAISVTAIGGVSYFWSNGLGNNATATITAPGTYTVTAVGANSTTSTASVTVTLNNTNTFTGTGNWTDNARWSCGIPPLSAGAAVIAAGARCTLNTNFTVAGNLTMDPTSTLIINPAITLTVTGTANFADQSVTFKSDAGGTASFGQLSGTITGATNVTVERYIPNNGFRSWRFLSVPTFGNGQTIRQAWQEGNSNPLPLQNNLPNYGTIITNSGNVTTQQALGFDDVSLNASLLTWAGTSWSPATTTNTAIAAGDKAYFLFIRGERSKTVTGMSTNSSATTLRTNGSIYTGDQIISATNSFSVIPNLYASGIDFTRLTRRGVGNVFYVWDSKKISGSSLGAYQTFSGTNGFKCILGGGSYTLGVPNTTIESGQAFFVLGGGTISSVTLKETAKTNVTDGNLGFRPLLTTEPATINTSLYRAGTNTPVDANAVVFDNAFSNAVDLDDAPKLSNPEENFGIANSISLAIEGRKPITDKDVINFSMWNMKEQDYVIEINAANIDTGEGLKAVLEDTYLKKNTALNLAGKTTVEFAVTPDKISKAANRFRIVFSKEKKWATETKNTYCITPNPVTGGIAKLSFNNSAPGRYPIRVIDNAGKIITTAIINHTENGASYNIAIPSTSPGGMYSVIITEPSKRQIVKKIVIINK